jgi:hypothetical protein
MIQGILGTLSTRGGRRGTEQQNIVTNDAIDAKKSNAKEGESKKISGELRISRGKQEDMGFVYTLTVERSGLGV